MTNCEHNSFANVEEYGKHKSTMEHMPLFGHKLHIYLTHI
jgi:hypothetical protein